MSKMYFVYLMTNQRNTFLYTGVTNDLYRRVAEHKAKTGSSFTKRYNVTKLIYYEEYGEISLAIEREKQIKSWSRKRKEELIKDMNPEWKELYDES
ncbi:MAG: GIY-YIG nuclease family protein [Anaerolineae bacterium]|nr:GIY-YIG nuclease family protein [Anaerolineae bacterium]